MNITNSQIHSPAPRAHVQHQHPDIHRLAVVGFEVHLSDDGKGKANWAAIGHLVLTEHQALCNEEGIQAWKENDLPLTWRDPAYFLPCCRPYVSAHYECVLNKIIHRGGLVQGDAPAVEGICKIKFHQNTSAQWIHPIFGIFRLCGCCTDLQRVAHGGMAWK